jgi:SAM-dependent methyltransferase
MYFFLGIVLCFGLFHSILHYNIHQINIGRLLAECWRILTPGGLLVVTDSLPGDLYSYRGFFEPYKEQWLNVDPDKLLQESDFIDIKAYQVAYSTWTRVGTKPK